MQYIYRSYFRRTKRGRKRCGRRRRQHNNQYIYKVVCLEADNPHMYMNVLCKLRSLYWYNNFHWLPEPIFKKRGSKMLQEKAVWYSVGTIAKFAGGKVAQ